MNDVEQFIAVMIAASMATAVAYWSRISYTIVLLILGLGLGTIDAFPTPKSSSDVILLLFLPPLLFEAAYVLDVHMLNRVRSGVLALALPGVILAMVVGGALVHWGVELPWSAALLFGAIVAATDPVAVLATFRALHVDRRLSTLIEGESLLNDGVALVLLIALVDAVNGDFRIGAAGGDFVLAVSGGVLIGIALGWIAHLVVAHIHEHLTEMTVSVGLAYGSFLLAEQLHFSGVLGTIAAAMTLGELGRRRGWIYSTQSEEVLIGLWEFLAFGANAALFLLMGLTVHSVDLLDHITWVAWGIAAALAGRAAVAYGMGGVLDLAGFPLRLAERHVLFWGGLRGAVALAAVLSLDPGFPYRPQLLAMTYGAVLFTLIVQGLTIGPLVRRLGLQAPPAPASVEPSRSEAGGPQTHTP
jgi:CPA1 family monovalent cation:H+ antiporter